MDTVILSSKGQLVIPKSVRTDAHITTGSRLQVVYQDGEIRLRPLTDSLTVELDSVAGCLFDPTRKPLTDAQTRAAIQAKLKAGNAP